jgi:hypothetical protein
VENGAITLDNPNARNDDLLTVNSRVPVAVIASALTRQLFG